MNAKTLELKQKILSFFQGQAPIQAENGYTAQIVNVKVDFPKEFEDLDKQIELKYNSGSLMGTIKGVLVIKNPKGEETSRSKLMQLMKFPLFTDRSTIISNGTEKFIQNQIRIKPGVYTTTNNARHAVRTEMRFARKQATGKFMPRLTISYDDKTNAFNVEILTMGKTQVFNVVNFMRELGFTDAEIAKALGNGRISDLQFARKNTRFRPLRDIYQILIGKMPPSNMDTLRMRQEIFDYFKNNALFTNGESVVSANIGSSPAQSKYFSKEVLSKSIRKTVAVAEKEVPEDDKDDIKFADVYSDTDLILEQIEDEYKTFAKSALSELQNNRKALSATGAGVFRPILKMGDGINDFISQASVVQTVSDGSNVVSLEANRRELTKFGDKYTDHDLQRGRTDGGTVNVKRELFVTGVNKIDPVEVPENDKLGLIQHMTGDAKIKNGTFYTKFYPVHDGVAKFGESNQKELSVLEEFNSKIAYYDSQYLTENKKAGTIRIKGSSIPGRYQGKNVTLHVNEVQYLDAKPQNIVGTSANMVPFVAHDDGTRILMACAQQKQAVNLVNREEPLVKTLYDKETGETYEDKMGREYGKPVYSETDGIVSKIDRSTITVKDSAGKLHKHQYYSYYPFNGTYINNELKVSVGQNVKKGQMLAEGWQTKNGSLAIGLNANVMYLPYKGYNYEDGIVISRSFANRMASEEIQEVEVLIPKNCKGGRGSGVLRELRTYTSDPGVAQLDADGIAKQGAFVKADSVLAAWLRPIDEESSIEDIVKAGDKNSKYAEKIQRIKSGSYVSGKIVRIVVLQNPDNLNKQRILFTLSSEEPLKVGDKLSGRHGNKGTVTKILDDDLMPTTQDGMKAEVLLSPLGVPSRKNTGQLFEVGAGLVAQKTGKGRVISNFDPKEKEKVLKDLEKIGVPDQKMKVFLKQQDENGIHNVPVENPVTVGSMYMVKLKHKVDEKIQSRSNLENFIKEKDYTPGKRTGSAKGEKHNPQRFGEMELKALAGHGAVWNALETTTLKSDGGGDTAKRIALFRALRSQKIDPNDLDFAATPETLNLLSRELKGLGLNITPMNGDKAVKSFNDAFDSLAVKPLKTEEFVKLLGPDKEVTKASSYDAKNIKSGDVRALEGGLFDPAIFGESKDPADDRNKWGYIRLEEPVANPMFAKSNDASNVYATLCGKKSKDIEAICKGSKVLVTDPKDFPILKNIKDPVMRQDYINKALETMAQMKIKPGDLVDPKALEAAIQQGAIIPTLSGGRALQNMLAQVDLKEGYKQAKKELKEAKSDKLDRAYKKCRVYESLIKGKYKPTDLMLTAIPVMPSYIRPMTIMEENGRILNDDLNKLYSNIITTNNASKKNIDVSVLPPTEQAKRSGSLYNSVSDFMGKTQKKDRKTGKELRSILAGLGSKQGMIRNSMLSKRVDFSGRSVIGVDPNLKLNEVAMPLDVAKGIYKPFIIKELVRTGRASNEAEATKKWRASDEDMKKALDNIVKDRPVVIGRQPSLHKYSLQAFNPIIKETEDGNIVRNIQLNPLVVTGFGADFDGDQMHVTIPISERAKEEAKELMMPTQNFINPTDGRMIIEIRHEMLAGLYYISSRTPTGNPKSYTTYKKLYEDYLSGKISSSQSVRTPLTTKTITAGQALINWCIPDKIKSFRKFDKPWGKSEVNGMMTDIYKLAESSNFKTISLQEIGNMFDALKKLGFEAATRSGVSISVQDFTKMQNISDIYNTRIKETKKTYGNTEKAQIIAWQKLEQDLQKQVKSGKALPKDNNLNIMMQSGARASAGQIVKMIGTVGVFQDIRGNLKEPVKNSFFGGLTPKDYYNQGNEARKGIYDRSVSTSLPGALSREVWHMAQDVVVREADCKTTGFVTMSKNDRAIRGRYCAGNVLSAKGKIICKKGQLIDDHIINILTKDDSVETIKVRSVLRCKTPHGVCQKCYGCLPGTLTPVKIGAPVGTLASQAFGEPVTQMTMKTFHTGGADSSVASGISRAQDVLNLSSPKENVAVISKNTGVVTEIEELTNGTKIHFGNRIQFVPLNKDGTNRVLKVKKGDAVTAGDFLTSGNTKDIADMLANKGPTNITFADPKAMFAEQQKALGNDPAINNTRDYLSKSMEYAFSDESGKVPVNAVHFDVLANKMTSFAQVTDPGDSPYKRGEYRDKNELDRWNNIAKTSNPPKRPILYNAKILSKQQVSGITDNWLGNAGFRDTAANLTHGAAFGQVDKLNDTKGRLMTGKLLNIGKGFEVPAETANTVSSKMYNFFQTLGNKTKTKPKKK